MKTGGKSIAAAVAIVAIAAVSWIGLKQYQRHRDQIACDERDAAFQRQLESIKQDAHRRLKIGAKKDEVFRFFADHGMRGDSISEAEVMGFLQTTACAPAHCGNGVWVRVQVKLGLSEAVAEEPTVETMYSDCPQVHGYG